MLISQSRTAKAADKRADPGLHINLLAEHEATKLTEVMTAIAARPAARFSKAEMDDVEKDVAPGAVLDAIEAA